VQKIVAETYSSLTDFKMEAAVFPERSAKFANQYDVISRKAIIFTLCEICPKTPFKVSSNWRPAWFDGLFEESGRV
jgi:hypothetical protein